MDKNNFSTFLRNNINDTFWDNYIELVRNEMIPYQLMALNDEIAGAPKSYCLENFKKAAITIQKINNNERSCKKSISTIKKYNQVFNVKI